MSKVSLRWLAGCCFSFFLAFISPAGAVEFPDKPAAQDFFVDRAGLLDPQSRSEINEAAGALLREQKIALFVVTLPSLASVSASKHTPARCSTIGASARRSATTEYSCWSPLAIARRASSWARDSAVSTMLPAPTSCSR